MIKDRRHLLQESDIIYVPEENATYNYAVTPDKPFNQCFHCNSFRNGCSGNNPFAMGIARACEFMQLARVLLGYSYQYVADETGVSLTSVKRILTGKVEEPGFFTFGALNRFLTGDPNGKFPCACPNIAPDPDVSSKLTEATREMERLVADNAEYKSALDNIHTSYAAEMQAIRTEAKEEKDAVKAESQKKIDHLLLQVDRLRLDVDYLRKENDRKAALIDKYNGIGG